MRFVELLPDHLKSIYRCISICALFLFLTMVTVPFFQQENASDFDFFVNTLVFLFIILNNFFPQKIEYLAFAAFILSGKILFTSILYENPAGFVLYIAACAILFARGYFRKNRWPKVGFFAAVFAGLLFTEIRFGSIELLKSLFTFLCYSFLIFLIVFFYYLYLRNHGKSTLEKFIDLSSYPELSERDKEWLELVLKETKYSTIATEYDVTEGTVKNRMRYIYKVLEVSDRIGLMATYGGFTLKK